MTDEIKEIQYELNILSNTILDDTSYCPSIKRRKILLDYITNLQEELKSANESIIWWNNRFKAVERDNERLKEWKEDNNSFMCKPIQEVYK